MDGEESRRDIEIVGLVRDLKSHNLWENPERLAYVPVEQKPTHLNSLQIRSRHDLAAVAPLVRAALAKAAPELPILDMKSLSEQIDRSLLQERLLSRLTGFFGLLALLLAAIGLYGVLAFGVVQRTGEIGIRIALGARQTQVLWMVLRTAMAWVAVGVALGLAAALAAGRLVSSLLFGLTPTDPRAILWATATLVLVAAFAGFWPAWRAARLDPVRALRCE